ncbi:D-isomer specific 2-hydroxyacid dehydrogenase family protein [Pseudomonas turukhanskensis]|uniref:Dihydrofolate reductase n=1 Tax=Pseudomonas turukhanskensis TaxID=1806536 RepID=A0A9W6K5V2_9PSED|nr:D-isomer specific 2-hydroxyacid dehydrogenase family protein [Pseudomonas turukhanskensis]GLK88559.1 dihydrofolate reductase [Pseudomonas turukhanskensis]
MSALRIASQLDVAFNARLRQMLPGVDVLDWPRGVFAGLPATVQVMLAAPHPKLKSAEEPAGWPYGLQWIQLVTSGVDFFPPWLLERVPVASARGTTAEAIAEFAVAAVFAAAKQLPALWVNNAGHWQQRSLASVSGSTLGLFGFGRIAQSTARKAQALGMKVVALRASEQPFELPGIEAARDLHDLFARADHLLLAAPATARTYRVIDRAVLASAKPGLHLINVARGSLIDQDALRDALDAGQIGLASLDVSDPEPLPEGHWLYRHPRVHLSPHTSANSPQVYLNIAELLARNIQHWRVGQALENAVFTARQSIQGVPA